MRKYRYALGMIALLCLLAVTLQPSFLSFSNLMNIIRQASVLLLLSLGLTGVILAGHIDLSVGSVAALTGCVCAKMMVSGYPIPQAILCSLLIGIICGLVNGLLVGLLSLPSFVSSYGVNMLVSGLALMVMNGGVIYDLPTGFTRLGIGYLGIFPVPVILAAVLYLLLCFLWNRTTYGRQVYMTGQNALAAVYSGSNQLKILICSFILSGFCGSIGGIVMTARLNAADAGMCDAYGLQIVAAVVVGGTSLLGGEGGVTGTVLGSLILTLIINIMNMNGVDSAWQNLVLGVIIIWTGARNFRIAGGFIDRIRNRLPKRPTEV